MVLVVRDLKVQRGDRDIHCPDLTLAPGGTLALAGPSGSGKTSLLLALAGILKPASGTVEAAGTSLWTLSEERRAVFRGRHMGYVFASFHLVDALTVSENLQLARSCASLKPDSQRALELLGQMGIAGLLKQRADRLSQGQMQRVAIARALMNHPKLLLCDEPTAALDEATAHRLIQLLTRVAANEGAALVIATHDRRVMDACAVTLRIDEGMSA